MQRPMPKPVVQEKRVQRQKANWPQIRFLMDINLQESMNISNLSKGLLDSVAADFYNSAAHTGRFIGLCLFLSL